jgi:hypothetical protein
MIASRQRFEELSGDDDETCKDKTKSVSRRPRFGRYCRIASKASQHRHRMPQSGRAHDDRMPEGTPGMIICSCNVISDHDVREAVVSADVELRSTAQVYTCLGCLVR